MIMSQPASWHSDKMLKMLLQRWPRRRERYINLNSSLQLLCLSVSTVAFTWEKSNMVAAEYSMGDLRFGKPE
jgi:hypothetical protein